MIRLSTMQLKQICSFKPLITQLNAEFSYHQRIRHRFLLSKMLISNFSTNDQKSNNSQKDAQTQKQNNRQLEKQILQIKKELLRQKQQNQKQLIQTLKKEKQQKQRQLIQTLKKNAENNTANSLANAIEKVANRKYTIYGLIVAALSLFAGIFWDDVKAQYRCYINRKNHREQLPQMDPDFVPDQSVENTIKQIVEETVKQQQNRLTLILGVQGIGKTQAIGHYINQLRSNGEEVYFYQFSLKKINQKKKKNQNVVTNVKNFRYFLSYMNRSYWSKLFKKDVYIFVDDINQLEHQDVSFEDRRQIRQTLLFLQKTEKIKVFLISSSTSFYHNIWLKDGYRKQFQNQYVIWEMEKQNYKSIIQNKCKKMNFTSQKQNYIAKYMTSLGYPLRKIIQLMKELQLINKTQSFSIKQQLKWLDQQSNLDAKKFNSKFQKALKFSKNQNQEQFPAGFEQILKQHLTEKYQHKSNLVNVAKIKCYQIANKVQQKYENSQNKITYRNMMESVYQYLDEQNYVIFCRPRNEAIRRYADEMFDPSKKEQRIKIFQEMLSNIKQDDSQTKSDNDKNQNQKLDQNFKSENLNKNMKNDKKI